MLEVVLSSALVAYILFDVNYFVRMFLTCFAGRYFRAKLGPTDANVTYGIALPWDVDTTLDHMNNSKVLREFDFSRMELGVRTGVAGMVMSKGGGFPVNANFIRYRLPVKPFSVFKVESKLLAWDEKHVFIQQSLTTLSDGIVRAVAYPKLSAAGWNPVELMEANWPGTVSPSIPQQFENMKEIGDIVSEKFKKVGGKKAEKYDSANGSGSVRDSVGPWKNGGTTGKGDKSI